MESLNAQEKRIIGTLRTIQWGSVRVIVENGQIIRYETIKSTMVKEGVT